MERPRTKGAKLTNKNIAADDKVGWGWVACFCWSASRVCLPATAAEEPSQQCMPDGAAGQGRAGRGTLCIMHAVVY